MVYIPIPIPMLYSNTICQSGKEPVLATTPHPDGLYLYIHGDPELSLIPLLVARSSGLIYRPISPQTKLAFAVMVLFQ